jgi:hypothetical protein
MVVMQLSRNVQQTTSAGLVVCIVFQAVDLLQPSRRFPFNGWVASRMLCDLGSHSSFWVGRRLCNVDDERRIG